ncbi:hypothetical protein ACFVFI_13405 [Streptomyces sp. NPDC057705]|uniref:hypothetical protein n=1 Tax=Streptomyces sp. NPDC057705 TaxID=3346222 RepID=UPI00367D5CCD
MFTGTGKSGAAAGADGCSPDPPPVAPVGSVFGAALPDGVAEADGDVDPEGEAEAEADGLADAELALASGSPGPAPDATEAAEPAGSFWPPQAETRVIAPMTASTDAYLQEERSTK